jgi:hypothetical protein
MLKVNTTKEIIDAFKSLEDAKGRIDGQLQSLQWDTDHRAVTLTVRGYAAGHLIRALLGADNPADTGRVEWDTSGWDRFDDEE